MGRKTPIGHDHHDLSLFHPVFSLSLLMASMAATIAMISALCIRRKKSSSFVEVKSSAITTNTETSIMPPSPGQATPTSILECEAKMANDDVQQINIDQLPLPPAMKKLTETYSCNNITRSMSMKKVETSISMKVSRSLSVKSQDQKRKGKLKSDQDSVWTKTIILGEKCRPDEDDTIIHDSKGNRISTYHKKTQSNFTLSRANSFIDQSSIPAQEKDNGKSTHSNFSLSRTNSFIDQSAFSGKTQNSFSLSRTNSFIDQRAILGQDKEMGITRKDEQVLV